MLQYIPQVTHTTLEKRRGSVYVDPDFTNAGFNAAVLANLRRVVHTLVEGVLNVIELRVPWSSNNSGAQDTRHYGEQGDHSNAGAHA